jgi:threonine dehydratase
VTLRAPTVEAARAARALVAPHILTTPLVAINRGHLKLESLQPTGSFKVRGFFNAALGADPQRREAGLMTVSAGNAALACAHVARHLGIPCRVVMFDTAPQAKRAGVERLGATVIPMAFQDLLDWLGDERWRQEPELFIHPFADERVITGHATMALELLDQLPELERVIVPVGGGGLITGVAATLKALHPAAEIIGVQSDGYPLWQEAFRAGGPVSVQPNTIADGTTGPFTADMFELLREHVDRWVVVPEGTLRRSVARLAMEAKLVVEGAGALAFAALDLLDPGRGSVAVVSGGNLDPSRLAEHLLEATR